MTNMLSNGRHKSFYYVSLVGISVVGKKLPIEESIFSPDRFGHGSTIIDSGTVVTRLRFDAFLALRDAFVAAFVNESSVSDRFDEFGTCYDLFEEEDHPGVPAIEFHFSNSTILPLPRRNVLRKVGNMGTFCLAFLQASSSISKIRGIGIMCADEKGEMEVVREEYREMWRAVERGVEEMEKRGVVASCAREGQGQQMSYVDLVMGSWIPWFLPLETCGGLAFPSIDECPALHRWLHALSRNSLLTSTFPTSSHMMDYAKKRFHLQ